MLLLLLLLLLFLQSQPLPILLLHIAAATSSNPYACSDKYVIVLQVQWFERRGSVPPALGAMMSEHEVVESDLCDTNLVGCIDKKAVIVRANNYTQVHKTTG